MQSEWRGFQKADSEGESWPAWGWLSYLFRIGSANFVTKGLCDRLKNGPLKIRTSYSLKLVNVTLFGKRVFADVIK